MAHYDPSVLAKYAGKLYSQANTTVIAWSVVGIIAGAFIGVVAAAALQAKSPAPGAAIGAIVGGLIGMVIGFDRSFKLRVQAQMMLVQKQIEENTRPR